MFVWIRALASRTRTWLSPRSAEEDFAQELETHLALLTEENLRRGMSEPEARRAARITLGGRTQLAETNRELRGLPMLETFLQDTRYALRMLRKNPGFTAVVVLTLALGIGANTAIFSVVYAVLLKPLPYANSDQLFNVFEVRHQDGIEGTGWSYANFADLREHNQIFTDLAGSQSHELTLTGRGEPLVVKTSVVSAELFSLFGQQPLAGRVFLPEDGKPGAAPVALLSENLWRGLFAADPKIIGSSIDLDKRSFTVVGVVPSQFRFPTITAAQQVWIPVANDPLFGPWMPNRSGHWFQVTGRLKPGVSMAQVRTEFNAISERLAAKFPAENAGWSIKMVPLRKMIVGDAQGPLFLLLGAVGLVLLIACANIANLLLARATSRAREMAVRIALGAAPSRIVRQFLTETAVLGFFGGVIGIAVAFWGVQILRSVIPENVPQVNEIRVDNLVLGFAIALSAIAACLFGLLPALVAAKSNVQSSLREGSARSGEGNRRRRARSALASAEVSLALILLLAAGLMLRSFAKLTAMTPGFEPQHIVKAEISLPQFQYSKPEQWTAFSDELLSRVQAQPGMQETALALPMPIADGFLNLGFDIIGNPVATAGTSRTANYATISPNYFQVMSIPLLAGRFFDAHDISAAPRVTIISRTMARIYFPNQDPLGQKLAFGFPPAEGVTREVVGIVGDIRDVTLGQDPVAMMYVPNAQGPFWGAGILVKSSASTATVAEMLRREVAKIDKDLPVTDVAAMPEVVEGSIAQSRFGAFLLSVFAAVALVLAAVGVFGVISYSVSCRTQEIGIRVALGASRNAILRMVSRETLLLTLAGLAVGIPCALAASHLLGHLLFGVSATDPLTLAIVTLTLFSVAVLAGYLPARRAMRVDPLVALRHE
jgi:predicted permease